MIDPTTGDDVVDVLSLLNPSLLNQKVLDHGFVRILDCMPRLVPARDCDFALADAARISYQKGTRKVSADAGLVDHLIRNRHTSPIEMGELKFHLRMPIFVMRQHVRHRMASMNEESARYSELASDFYIPSPEHWAVNTAANKQATVQGNVTPEQAKRLHQWLLDHNEQSYALYEKLLAGDVCEFDGIRTDIPGIAREQARMVLGVNIYTQCIWKIDLKNLLHYLSLRCDAHAQFEIRALAEPIRKVVAALFPGAWASFQDHFMDGVNLGRSEIEIVRALLGTGDALSMARALGWTGRRAGEFATKVRRTQLVPDAALHGFLLAMQTP